KTSNTNKLSTLASSNGFRSVVFVNNNLLATRDFGESPKYWDLKDIREPLPFGENKPISCTVTAFSPDKAFVATGFTFVTYKPEGPPGSIKVFDVQKKKELYSLKGPKTEIYSLSFSPNNELLAAGCERGLLQIWNIKKQDKIFTKKTHQRHVVSLVFSPD